MINTETWVLKSGNFQILKYIYTLHQYHMMVPSIHLSLCHYLDNAYHVTLSCVLTSWEKWFLSNCCDQCCVCLFLILSLRCIIFMILHILLFLYSSIDGSWLIVFVFVEMCSFILCFVLSVRNHLWVVECVSKACLLITFDNWYFDSCICAPFSDFSLLTTYPCYHHVDIVQNCKLPHYWNKLTYK